MLKRNKILLIVLAILISLVAFLSFGFQTSNFNDLIQKRFNDQYKKVKLEFKDIRVSLDIKDFAVKFSLNQPKLYHKGDLTNIYQTNLSKSLCVLLDPSYISYLTNFDSNLALYIFIFPFVFGKYVSG